MIRRLIRRLWLFVWRRRFMYGDRLVRITGWRSAWIDDAYGQRMHVTFMPIASWRLQRELRRRSRDGRW